MRAGLRVASAGLLLALSCSSGMAFLTGCSLDGSASVSPSAGVAIVSGAGDADEAQAEPTGAVAETAADEASATVDAAVQEASSDLPEIEAELSAPAIAADEAEADSGVAARTVEGEVVAASNDASNTAAGAPESDDGAQGNEEKPTYRDGVYQGEGSGGRFGIVPVTVTIEDGAITRITVGANEETAAMAEKAQSVVVPQIIEKQSTEDIDMATGATLTSQAIVDGVASVLERAAQ